MPTDIPKPLRALIVEDSADDAQLMVAELEAGGHRLEHQRVETEAAMSRALVAQPWDIVLSDYNLPSFSAVEALDVVMRIRGDIPFIIVSGMIGEEAAVALVKAGATDFVMKTNLRRLCNCVERGLREAAIKRSHRQAVSALAESDARFKALVANLPGVVFQAMLGPTGPRAWLFISDGCQPLLGVPASALETRPELLADMIVAEDRNSFVEHCRSAIAHMKALNWEGRLLIGAAKDLKWVNLRASLRRIPGGSIIAEGIVANITQSKLAEQEIVRSREQLRELSVHLDGIKEQERADIAREVHDELGGTLTAAKIDLLSLLKQLPPERLDLVTKSGSIEVLLDQAMDISRRISRSLRPAVLDYGIVAAIEWQARDFAKRLDIPCEFSCRSEEIQLEPERLTPVFRIFQEALTNVAKHSGATHVWVNLGEDDAGRIGLRIVDDGQGVADGDLNKGGSYGIRGMRERAQFLGGELRVTRLPGKGTEVELSFPRTQSAPAEHNPVQQPLSL